MRKFQLLLVLLISSLFLFGQEKIGNEHLNVDFSTGFLPEGWTIDAQTANWTAAASNNAGGTAPEARMSWEPQFNGITRLISPQIDVSGFSTLRVDFKHAINHYSGAYTVGVATRSNSGTWNTVWSRPGITLVQNMNIAINNADVGSTTFQICFFFSGASYNINYWYIDDIILYTPSKTDFSVNSIDVDRYIPEGTYSVATTLKNNGADAINSCEVHYQIDNNEPITETLTGLNIATGQNYPYTFPTSVDYTTGNYLLKVWISNINESGTDLEPSNDLKSTTIHVASQTVTNLPLFEEFTSSTCGPCASFNFSTFTPFMTTYAGQFAIIKYQMSWPAPGDPYYTAEGGVRRFYYGVTGVPTLETGGKVTGTNTTAVTAAFNSEKDKLTFFEISASSYILGTTVNASVEVLPYMTVNGFKLHAAVVEKVTTGNVGNNGETSFKYVMMKMLPDASGTTVDFTDGVPFNVSFSQDLSATNVEEYSDLMLVVFIQNDEDKEVFQSQMVESPIAYPVTFNVTDNIPNSIEGAEILINGERILTNETGVGVVNLPDGTYPYTIDAMGFELFSGTAIVAGDVLDIDVELVTIPTYTLTVTVKDIDVNLIEGALVAFEGQEVLTNELGVAVLTAEDGTFDYVVSKASYITFTGSTTIAGSNMDVAVTLELIPTNTITFTVLDIEEQPIEGATILVNGEEVLSSEFGIATIDLYLGTYNYTIQKDGFYSVTGIVDTEVTTEVTAHLIIKTYPVNFVVKYSNQLPVVGATILINEQSLTTNANGFVSISLPAGNYSYVVSAEGFDDILGDAEVLEAALNINVEFVLPEYNVTFVVANESSEPLEGAVININSETITTDVLGEATISLYDGYLYNYSITMDGYDTYNGSVTVAGDDLTENVQLTLTSIDNISLTSASLYPNPTNGNFSINMPNVAGKVGVNIYSVTGSLVESKQFEVVNGKIDMNISQPKGVYYVTLTLDGGTSQTLKLVVK